MDKPGYWPTVCLQKILLPVLLLAACCLRQNGLSSLYLILLFINPFVPVASSTNVTNGGPGHYLIINIIFPSLNLIAQVIFQLVLLSYKVYLDALVPPCNPFESILRHIGLVSFKGLPVLSMIYLVTPEILLIISSVLIYSCCCFFNRTKPVDDNLLPIVLNANHTTNHESGSSSRRRFSILTTLGKYVCLFSLCMAGIIQPSLPGLLYFVFFLTCMTWWSFNQNLGRGFAKVCCILPVLLCLHTTSIFVYQTQWAQQYFPDDSPIARYAGLVPLFKINCTMPAVTEMTEAPWTEFVNPVILVWLFFIICYETKMLLRPPLQGDKSSKEDGLTRQLSARLSQRRLLRSQADRWRTATRKVKEESARMNVARTVTNAPSVTFSATEATPLIRGRESLYKKHGRGKSYLQDSQGSVIVSDEQEDIHRLEDVPEEGESDGGQGILELVLNGMMVIAQLITQSSYIGTNITMMTLQKTNQLVPKFDAMLRSSPFLVFYAMVLLIIQYVYGMKVTEVEIPEEIKGFNMKQIGFEKHPDYPVTPLFIKTMFTMMFWMTLRQYNREKWEASNAAALADMATPLQTGTPSPTEAQTKTSQFIQDIGQYLREFLIKYWIWVVAIFLFFIGISGERMTIFRIVYMALALIFVLTFQLSWMLWRKIMYGFWLTVIIYSMLILVLTYTYQFDYFPEYWDNYLHVNKKLQLDIGLQKFETTELFIRLLTPTFFVIITVIQLYYFHKDFLAISDIKSRGSSSIVRSSVTNRSKRRRESKGDEPMSDEAVPEIQSDPEKPPVESDKGEGKPKKLFSTLGLKKVIVDMWHNIENVIEFGWLFLELHMLSIIMIIIFVLAIYDVCALHFILIILAVVALAFGTNIRTVFAHIASVLISNTTDNKTASDTLNYAKWLGFGKTTNETTLIDILDGYIVIILVVTLHTVVTTRQKYKRHLKGRSLGRPTTMFSRITYKDIDKDLVHCVKYLINYGFYRFGVEICLMAMVILISLRMDIVAVMYAFWLCILIRPNRLFLYRVWGLFRVFISLTVPLQYLIVIGLPPGLCFEFNWSSNELWQRAQEWLYLPDPNNPPSAKKIICDFIVLFVVCRQAVMFSIEKQHEADRFDYAGGTNRSIIDEIDRPDFVIPVPDFITYTNTILDVLKQKFMMMFIWFTLIFFFLAGTERVNIFSLGYLIGSFIFFWQGNDLFLLHIKVILRWWKYLIVYNVTVILCKAILQIAGCIFINEILQANSCWFIESFGIGCIKKFRTHFPGDPKSCVVPQGDAGLAWDGFCFAFLIMQRRLFNSYYFQHIVNETKAMAILASRGAELIQELSTKQIREQQEAERRILEKIKYKMDRIKASQQRVQGQGPEYREPANHHVGQCYFPLFWGENRKVSKIYSWLPLSAYFGSLPTFLGLITHCYKYYNFFENILLLRHNLCTRVLCCTFPALFTMRVCVCVQPTASAPLAHDSSGSISSPLSLQGYHTPVEDDMPHMTPLIQAPTPTSAIMTVSLDAYLDPQRMSFGSPPNSEMLPRIPSIDDSFPVFSPPPYGAVVTGVAHPHHRRGSSFTSAGPPWMPLRTPRHSFSTTSQRSHHTSIRSGDYYMFEDMDEELDLIEEQKSESSEEAITDLPSVSKFLSDAMKTGIFSATEKAYKPKALLVASRKRRSFDTFSRRPSVVPEVAKFSSLPDIHSSTYDQERQQWQSATDLPASDETDSSDEPKPGPSTEGVDYIERDDRKRDGEKSKDGKSDSDSDKEEKQEETKASCLLFMKFLWTLLVSILVSLTNMFNRFSKDYRFIMRILSVEKKLLKETSGFGQGVRAGSAMMWHPRPDIVCSKPKLSLIKLSDSSTSIDITDSHERVESLEDLQTAKDKRNTEKWLIIQFIQSLWFALMSRSELVCYFMIFLNQIKSATLLSLPLPSMVFLWGTLTVPRPSKNFWISVIAYTQTVIVIKCLFQFKILSWDEQAPDNRPFFLPRIIGIERKPNYVTFDLLLLLMVFFHRSVLKSLGLWKTTSEASSQTMLQLRQMESEANLFQGGSGSEHKQNIRERLKRFFSKEASVPTDVSEDLSESADGSRDRKSMLTIRYPVETPFECLPQIIPLTASKYFNPAKGFFKSLLEPSVRVTADVYAYMFFCDFFNLIVIIFGFAAFGSQQGDGGVAKYIEENRVPIPFLVMLILQFLLIIVDRTLYLRKYILGKIVFQFILVIGIHIWMFFVLPAVTERQFNAALPPQIWYMVKCFYLLLSAYQIRSGYPTRILGNFLCKSYNILNMYLFKLFMLVPFVFEIRALMDWIWTDTSMTLPDWLKMEDIFAHIFQLKCQRRMETEYPQARGEKKTASSKYIYGGGFLFGIFAVLWFPLVWFALGNTVGEPNLPYEVSVSVRIGGYQPIYSMSARNNSIHKLNEQHWERINSVYKRSRKAQTFLSSYSYQDVGVVQFSSHSTSIWTISPPDLGSLIKETQSVNPMTIKMDWSALKISTNPEEPSQLNSGTEVVLMPDDPNRQNLVNLLQNKDEGKPLYLKSIFPKFIKVTNRGTINPIKMLMKTDDEGPDGDEFRNVRMDLHRLNATGEEPTVMWWVIKEDCNDTIYKDILSKLPYEHTCDNLIMYTFNDKAFPPTFNFISGKGIIGMYTTFVIVVHSFIRGFFTGVSFRIMFDDMPYIDRVLQLCRDIYLVRESGELDLEEDLFAKLVFLYRSPETLIKWTRPPDEVPANEEEDIPPLEN
ncbi:piezo-type mechanosensitive ion channel component [Nilaparvata lugens]|uniref:piezo-type mechanosensitive ion channel component n=1 Tax=Nilaparvata lugens TaxID=108931 RepID=UPI00193CE8F7|nr:piezo-type mechanosensitive ion channel component [Nilaparvata lugens]